MTGKFGLGSLIFPPNLSYHKVRTLHIHCNAISDIGYFPNLPVDQENMINFYSSISCTETKKIQWYMDIHSISLVSEFAHPACFLLLFYTNTLEMLQNELCQDVLAQLICFTG